MFGSYIMFHYVRGVPFDFNSGAYDNLNMWEQIDDGAQYTPAKKFLLSVPIVLFLLSTHYTHYDLTYFTINFLAVLAVVIPKLPFVRPRGDLYILDDPNELTNNFTESPHESWFIFRCTRGLRKHGTRTGVQKRVAGFTVELRIVGRIVHKDQAAFEATTSPAFGYRKQAVRKSAIFRTQLRRSVFGIFCQVKFCEARFQH